MGNDPPQALDSRRISPATDAMGGRVWWLRLMPILLVLILAAALRLYRLVPAATGLLYAQDADEGVYATTAQLALQGSLPYRDFFTPMPPGAIYLFMAVLRAVYTTWGSPAGLVALRYVCVLCGLATVAIIFWIAQLVGGRSAGLLASIVVAVDGIVVAQDRRAMLEAPTNLLSALAVLVYLLFVRKSGEGLQSRHGHAYSRRLLVASGALCALALLTKATAVVPVLVIALDLVLRRRPRELALFSLGLTGAYLLLAAPFLLRCPVDLIKQNYVFHLLRPYGGTAHPLERLKEMWSYTWSWSTVRLSLAGLGLTTLVRARLRSWAQTRLVVSWAALSLILLLGSRSYWATYFSGLALPLSILGGLAVNSRLDHSIPALLDQVPLSPGPAWRVAQLVAAALIVVPGWRSMFAQYTTTRTALEAIKPAYLAISEQITERVPEGEPILVFETNYTFLSSHPPSVVPGDGFFVDSYGEMLYRNLEIEARSWGDLLSDLLSMQPMASRAVFHRQPAQSHVLSAFDAAGYLVYDGRAANQLTSESIAYMLESSQVLAESDGAQLRIRTGQSPLGEPGR